MAPELHLNKSYTGEAVDLFAAAVILFTMVTQRPPFAQATVNDPLYKLLAARRPSTFWAYHKEGNNDQELYSDDFKSLFENMMMLNRR